jgi:hypothetical protein
MWLNTELDKRRVEYTVVRETSTVKASGLGAFDRLDDARWAEDRTNLDPIDRERLKVALGIV